MKNQFERGVSVFKMYRWLLTCLVLSLSGNKWSTISNVGRFGDGDYTQYRSSLRACPGFPGGAYAQTDIDATGERSTGLNAT